MTTQTKKKTTSKNKKVENEISTEIKEKEKKEVPVL